MPGSEQLSEGLFKISLQKPVEDAFVGRPDEKSAKLLERLGKIKETPEDKERWEEIIADGRIGKYERAFTRNERARSTGMVLAAELLFGEDNKIQNESLQRTLDLDHIKEIRVDKRFSPDEGSDEYVRDQMARAVALIRAGLKTFKGAVGAGGIAGVGQGGGGEGGSLFNTLDYAELIRSAVKGQLRERAGLGDEELGDITWQEARQRVNRLFASMFIGGDRQDLQFVWQMKTSDTTFMVLLGDWLRELPEASDRVDKTLAAMQQQMSTDGKRAEELTRSGIKDTDFLRMLAYKFPFAVTWENSEGQERNTIIEASAWDAVDYLYGNKRTVRNEEGKPLWTIEKDFTSSNGKTYQRGVDVPLDELTNEDMLRINKGEVFAYPKFDIDVFDSKPKVPGSDLLTKRADEIAHGSNWGYFEHLLAKNGISVNQVKDFINPFDEVFDQVDMELNIGLGGDFGADWLDKLSDFNTRSDKGKLLVIRNLAAGMAPVFSAGANLARMLGHEAIWNPTYDYSRVMRIMENTLSAQAYDEAKGVSLFDLRPTLLHPAYPDYHGRMAQKAHPWVLAWQGKTVDISDRRDPWEDNPKPAPNDNEHSVRIKPIEKNMDARSEGEELSIARRKFEFGLISEEEYSTIKEKKESAEKQLLKAKRLDEYMLFERALDPGDYDEMIAVNWIYQNATYRVLNGEDPAQVLEDMDKLADEQLKKTIHNPDFVASDVYRVSNSSRIVAKAIGLSPEEKIELSQTGRDAYDLLYGLAKTDKQKAELKELHESHPAAFQGVMADMLYASELNSLTDFDYGKTEREIEAWLRYLSSNADVYGLSKSLARQIICTQIDPELLKDAYFKMYSPDDYSKGLQHKGGKFISDIIDRLTGESTKISEAEASALFKELQGTVTSWVDKHADMNWKQRRKLFKSFIYMLEGWLDSGMEFQFYSESSMDVDADPGDRHVYLTVKTDPNDKSLLPNERILHKGLTELFERKGFPVDFNAARKEGKILLNGGAQAFMMFGTMQDVDGVKQWMPYNLHDSKDTDGKRPTDRFGMGVFTSRVFGSFLMKLGTDAGIITASDWSKYQKDSKVFADAKQEEKKNTVKGSY